MPGDHDNTPEAHIVRIKCLRNELCHSISTGIPNDVFEGKWVLISRSLVALGLGQKEVDRLNTESIDHETKCRVEEAMRCVDWEPRVSNVEQELQELRGQISNLNIRESSTCELSSRLPDEVAEAFGRSQEIQKTTEAIRSGSFAVVVITGAPGFGKTTVANKVAHELAKAQEGRSVFYCSLRSKTTLNDVVCSMILACSTNLPQPPENPHHWLMNWSKQQLRKVTFVLDYADDALESQDSREKPFITMMHDIRTLSKQKITFVITSRKTFQADGSYLKIENIRLSSLLPDDATRLLLSKVHNEKSRQKLTQTEKIVELCGCVPLALCIVGSLLLDYKEDRLISSLEKEPLDILQDDEISFENTIRTSFDLLKPSEQEDLVILSVFPRSFDSDAADSVIAERTDSGVLPMKILRSLKNRSLLEQTNSGKYQIHQLIQAFAKKIGKDKFPHVFDGLEQVVCAHFLNRLCSLADVYWSKDKCKEAIDAFNGDRHNFEYFLQFYVQAMADQLSSDKLLESSTERFLDRFPQKCMYLEMCLLPSFYTMILQELLTHFYTGNYPVQAVELLCLLAHEKRKVGNLEEYIELMNQAKYIYHWNYTEFRLKGLSQVLFFNSYARFLFEKRFPKSLSHKVYRIALRLCNKKLGEYPETAVTLLLIGKHRKRIPDLQVATKLFTACLGEHFMTAQGHKAIADVYFAHRDTDAELDMALFHYQQALDMMEKCGMGGHKESILALKNYAMCLRRKGDYEEAGVFLEKAKRVAEIELEDDHLWKVLIDTQLALLYEDFGHVEKAKEIMKNALEMCLKLGQSIDRLGSKREIHQFLTCYDCYPGFNPEEKKIWIPADTIKQKDCLATANN